MSYDLLTGIYLGVMLATFLGMVADMVSATRSANRAAATAARALKASRGDAFLTSFLTYRLCKLGRATA
ncbi:hypothetical protein ACFWNG_03965 [Streptomyces sp. NPDC058391]|uniref:hypothetical protein n=1 Tax=Streptomyces sp. NPDC058391 TaxID=3346476 RepID=UPI003655A1F1